MYKIRYVPGGIPRQIAHRATLTPERCAIRYCGNGVGIRHYFCHVTTNFSGVLCRGLRICEDIVSISIDDNFWHMHYFHRKYCQNGTGVMCLPICVSKNTYRAKENASNIHGYFQLHHSRPRPVCEDSAEAEASVTALQFVSRPVCQFVLQLA